MRVAMLLFFLLKITANIFGLRERSMSVKRILDPRNLEPQGHLFPLRFVSVRLGPAWNIALCRHLLSSPFVLASAATTDRWLGSRCLNNNSMEFRIFVTPFKYLCLKCRRPIEWDTLLWQLVQNHMKAGFRSDLNLCLFLFLFWGVVRYGFD